MTIPADVKRELGPDFSKILDSVTRVIERRKKRDRPMMREQLAERYGMGAPEMMVGEMRFDEEADSKIDELVANLLMQRHGETREERLIGEQRTHATRMTREQWAEADRRAKQANVWVMAESEKGRAFTREGWTRQERLMKEERKREEKTGTARFWARLGVGAITGFLAPGLLGVKALAKGAGFLKGAGRLGLGAIRGAAFGPEVTGRAAGYQWGGGMFKRELPPWLQDYLRRMGKSDPDGVAGVEGYGVPRT